MKTSAYPTPPPFTVLYTGHGKFIVHKGYVFQANDGTKLEPTLNGEVLSHGWTGDGATIPLESGQTLSLVIEHGSKDEKLLYEIVDILSARIEVGQPSDLEGDEATAIEIATVEYGHVSESPTINQVLNSDAYILIFGTRSLSDE